MVSKEQRRHELARAKLLRQQQKREEEAAKRRRLAIIASALAVLLVVGGVSFLALRNNDVEPVAAPSPALTEPATTAEPTRTKTPKPPKTSSTVAPAAGSCSYVPDGETATVTPPPEGEPAALAAADVTMETSQGTLTLALDPATAPCTVQSFVSLATQGYFDGTTCHRLTTDATLKVLQCGDPTATGSGGPGYSFADETTDDMTYLRGTVAMANSGPDTNGSQFFLVYGDSQLPPSYTVFGEVTGGLEILDTVAAAGISEAAPAPALPVDIASVAVATGA